MIEMGRRMVDWLVMASAGSLLVGLFQGEGLALVISMAGLVGSLAMTWAIARKEGKR